MLFRSPRKTHVINSLAWGRRHGSGTVVGAMNSSAAHPAFAAAPASIIVTSSPLPFVYGRSTS